MIVDHLENLPEQPVTSIASRCWLDARLGEPLPEEPEAVESLLAELGRDVFANIGRTNHPRFFAFVPSPSNYVSVLADALAGGFNVFGGNWLEASGPVQVELLVLDWLRRICGLPESAGGVLVSGGSVANLTGLAAARRAMLSGEGHAAQPASLAAARIYGSDQVHSSVDRALRVLGFGPEQFVRLACDEEFRLSPAALAKRVTFDRASGLVPFCVVASAGTTNTGAVDPLEELAELCEREKLWLHVDGAYGAAAALCQQGQKLLAGLGRVDSLSIDPHKWLFQPYEIGCVLVKDRRALLDAFAVSAEYLKDVDRAGREVNFQDLGIQLTRSFRGLKLWLSIKTFGLSAFRRAMERGIGSAEKVQECVERHEELELVTPAQLAIVTFRYVGRKRADGTALETIDRWNGRIVDRILTDGFATVTSTVLRGRKVLRMCTINPRTTDDDLAETLERIVRFGREAAAK
jgi:glutamate/tyrosine decarboxylase-like PLP-dependent enzyme